MSYYVYVILDTRKPGEYNYKDLSFEYEPFYVGRGKGRRTKTTLKEGNDYKLKKIDKIEKEGCEVKVIKLYDNLSFKESQKLEIDVISKIGRYDLNNGHLVNFTDGGEGRKNIVISDETRKKMRKARLGVEPWNKGVSCSDETRKKISQSLSGENNFNYGKHFSEEHKRKLSESNKVPQCLSVMQYDLDGNFIEEFKSMLDAETQTKINKTSIGKCCRNINNTAGGYKWEFTKKSINKRNNKKETNTKLKNNILRLLSEGKEIKEISEILKCSLVMIYYYKKIKFEI